MIAQLELEFAPVVASPELPCAFGNLRDPQTVHHCADCTEAVEEGRRRFDAQVLAGEYNARGYTRSEWKRSGHDPDQWAAAEARLET